MDNTSTEIKVVDLVEPEKPKQIVLLSEAADTPTCVLDLTHTEAKDFFSKKGCGHEGRGWSGSEGPFLHAGQRCWWLVTKTGMRADMVVMVPPLLKQTH